MSYCKVCGSKENVENHHLTPKIRDPSKNNVDTIPLCRYHHRMMDPWAHPVDSEFYPFDHAKKVCRLLNKKFPKYLFSINPFWFWCKSSKGKLYHLKTKQYSINARKRGLK